MARFSRTPRKVPEPTPRGEMIAQVLTGVVLGIGAVYAAAVIRRGPVVALVVLLIGASYLVRNWHRVKWVARGFLTSGLAALAAVLIVLLLGHDIF
ncbi:hypothetical protein [Nocardioides sp.]|uniref:hypothetical protein n=1 Tax=Nocardioides sp. TaxID=35761 RepID=UPI002B2723D8|nr:hypothetical protein [Nocardioides sp.]